MAWYRRLRNVFRTEKLNHDIDREMSFHIEERADELRERGMSKQDALRRARRQFGNPTLQAERTRDADAAPWLVALGQDLRYSTRSLAKSPVFTSTVVLTLALGIGANSAVFSAINAVLLRPLPFPEGDQLMRLRQIKVNSSEPSVAPIRLMEWSRLNTTFHAITGYYTNEVSELSGDLPESVKQAHVAPRFLEVWGVAPALGRNFRLEEERFGGPSVVLISDRFWHRRFHGDPGAVGKQLRLGAASAEIVGIMPASFLFPDREVDIWSPQPMDAPYAQDRESTWFAAIGRLKPGATVEQAQADLSSVQANLAALHPKPDAQIRAAVEPLKNVIVGGAGRSLWVLFGSVTVLLLIACTNIATLLLSRATQRRHEIAVRFSLGASRSSVVARFLIESFLLALAGAAIGLGVAAGAFKVFRVLTANLPRIEEIDLDARIVLYTLACAVFTTLLCGLYPAIRHTAGDLSGTLVQTSRSQLSQRSPAQLFLVGIQVSLAVALLIGAGLLLRSFHELGRVSPGFDVASVITFRMTGNWGETANLAALRQRTQRILDQLQTAPGVESAALAMALPGVPAEFARELKIEGGPSSLDQKILAESRYVSPGFFRTMRIPLLAGEFCRDDTNEQSVNVNRAFAATYFPGANVVGRRIQRTGDKGSVEIRGIVGDARELGLHRAPVPTVYSCYTVAQPGAAFLVRTRGGDALAMAETLRRKVREIDPGRSILDVGLLEERIDGAFAENRLRTFLLVFFAATAISLACVGLYGTLSYIVSSRRREIGLRLALGALRSEIITHFLAQGLRVSVLACLAGLALGSVGARLLAGMLYGVSAYDALTLVTVVTLVLAVALLASLLPALRAARLDPIQALREE